MQRPTFLSDFSVAPVRLHFSALPGRGLSSLRQIPRSDIIGEYDSERVLNAVADQREVQYGRVGSD